MKTRIEGLLMALLLPAAAQGSYNYTNSDGVWGYTTNGGSATIITYTGSAHDVTIPDTVTGGIPITAIFSLQLTPFTSVTIPRQHHCHWDERI